MKKIYTGLLNIICYTLMALMLSACGFHLKGYMPEDGENTLTALDIRGINRYDDIGANVKQLAETRNIKITPDAEWAISLSDEKLEHWQASTTQTATDREFVLSLHIKLYIHHKGITYEPIELAEESMFQDNANESGSKSNEQDVILDELRRELAYNILRRVQAIANNPPECDDNEPEPAAAQ